MEKYHKELNDKLKIVYGVAQKARIQGLDPRDEVEIPIAKNMAERVEGLISVVAPQVKGSGIVERIQEFEIKFGKLDWRVALNIAEEVAREKFCKFKDKREAMEVGIRVGIAYVTNGVVASPLEGFTQLKIRKRRDGKEYFALYFSGPIRSAGGTGASVSVIIGDYIRKKMGYAEFDPDEREIKRFTTELTDYHEKVTNLQYFPSAEELEFMVSNLAVQIDGDPSEKYDVSNYKDLERVETNKIRNGPCLVLGEGLCQKAPKLLKQLDKWGKDMDLGHWKFLEEFLKIQKKIKAREEVKKVDDGSKIKPDYTFIKDLVAGRPVLTHPLRTGGFRLRYGRARNTGLSSNAIHPATMFVLNNYIAVGTQIKMERPGKASALSLCDTIEGPIIKLKDQSVILLSNAEEAKKYAGDVEEILFLGDILISYGDFFNRAHMLVPCGYNEEWWAREIEKAIEKKFNGNIEKASEFVGVKIQRILLDPFNVSFSNALKISEKLDVPFVPRLTYHWKDINKEQFNSLVSWVRQGAINEDRVVLPFVYDINSDLRDTDPKRVLELLGVPHKVVGKEHVVVEGDYAKALVLSLNSLEFKEDKVLENGLDAVNKICYITQRDKSGTFIGARMGRPEKAKMRKMTGKPHCLFPVGDEGGRMRSFQSAIGVGRVTGDFPLYVCNKCNSDSIYPICVKCNGRTEKQSYCYTCKKETEKCEHADTIKTYKRREILIRDYFKQAQDKLGINELPELIKGIRGLSSEEHVPENLIKGILRAANDVYVNKDGTIRYDATELTITHFKPIEIGTSIVKLKELGYEYDVYGNPLEKDTQIIEIKPQDVIIPACKESLDEGGDDILLRSCKFIDGMLKYMYNLEPFYNVDEREDLVGHLIMAIAPHISAGIICRIIGFSNTQGFYAHPMLHCAVRRDCFSYNTFIPIYDGKLWRNVKIGEFVEELNPETIVDAYGTKAKKVKNLWTLGYKNGKVSKVKINEFTKHTPSPILRFELEDGRNIDVTEGHKFCVLENEKIVKRKVCELKKGDYLTVPSFSEINEKDVSFINLEEYFHDREDIVIRDVSEFVKPIIENLGGNSVLRRTFNFPQSNIFNFLIRDSFPLPFLLTTLSLAGLSMLDLPEERKIAVKRDTISLPHNIPLNDEVLNLIGLYVAEGHARKNESKKGFYHVSISCTEEEIRDRVKKVMNKYFNLNPSEDHEDHLTFSSKILYEFFVDILKAGHNAYNKRIPGIILNLPKEKLSSFLRGYFDGDGSVSRSDRRVTCDSVSSGLLTDLEFALRRYGLFTKRYQYSKEPGPKVRDFYIRKKRKIPVFSITKLLILSDYIQLFYEQIGFSLKRKQKILEHLIKNTKPLGMRIKKEKELVLPRIKAINHLGAEETYCLNVENNIVIANGILTGQCDGDEVAIMLLLDALINFSRVYLPAHRGATQDAPLVLSSTLIPSEIDDMVFDLDIAAKYPLDLYKSALEYKMPWEVKIEQMRDRLGKENEQTGWMFTHDVSNINSGVVCSAYKSIPDMQQKVFGQLDIAEKIRAVDEADVARLVIDRHFIRDIKGNLRKFSTQEFRCVSCNEKYRRPPLLGHCIKCRGKLLFTVSEGSVVKYLEPSISLAQKYELPNYLKQSLELTKMRIESVFGKDKERQTGLGSWY